MQYAQSHPNVRFLTFLPGVVTTDFGKNSLHGGVDSRTLPHSQTVEQVVPIFADALATRCGDVYTRAGAAEQSRAHLEALAAQ